MPSPKKPWQKIPTKFQAKAARSRNPLTRENGLANDINMLMVNPPSPRPSSSSLHTLLPSFADAGKENRMGLSLLLSPKNLKSIVKREDARQSFERTRLQQMQEKIKEMGIAKEKVEELLKDQEKANRFLSKQLEEANENLKLASIEMKMTQEILTEKDKTLSRKDKQLENLGKQQEKLQIEVKRLRKMKEFKPTLSLSFIEEEVDKKACPPRKSSSAYMLWRKDQWNRVKKENPNAQIQEICSILGMKWKNLSAEEKKPYEERHMADKKSHLQIIRMENKKKSDLIKKDQRQKAAMELLEQYLLFKKESDKARTKTRKEQDHSKPKQPLSSFFLFLNERRPALLAEKKNAFEISKIAGEEWKNMNEEKKAPYIEIAKKLKDEYLLQIAHDFENEDAAGARRMD